MLTADIKGLCAALDDGEDVLNLLADALVDAGVLDDALGLTRYDPRFRIQERDFSWWKSSAVEDWGDDHLWLPGRVSDRWACVLPDAVWERLRGSIDGEWVCMCKRYDTLSAAYIDLARAIQAPAVTAPA